MHSAQINLQWAEEKLVGLDIFKSEFPPMQNWSDRNFALCKLLEVHVYALEGQQYETYF